MTKKYKQKIAVILSILVIMLPIYSSMVFADLLMIEARGQNNVKNYIRENDFITFKATASITGNSTITPNQVILGSNLQFDSCEAGIDGFDCTLRFPGNGTTVFDARAIPYTITLKDDAGNAVDTKTDNLFVDNLPPAITSFNVDQALISSGVVRFNFDVTDGACAASSCAGKCAGIKRVELSDTNSSFKEIITLNTDACSVSEIFEVFSLQFSEGNHIILAKAFDKFEQISSAASAEFKIDKSAPFIDLNTFRVADETNADFGFFGPNPVAVTLKIGIKDSNLDKSSVFADLNELSRNANLGNVQAVCGSTENDITTCSWQINLAPDSPGLKKAIMRASDSFGNNASAEIKKNFELDNTGPVVLSLASEQIADGQSFARLQDNNFTATFREDVGVKAADIKLHASGSVYTADACTQTLDIWQCAWNDVDFATAGKVNVSIGTDSKDRLGNFILQKFSKEVIVDSSKPKLLKLVVRSIGGREALLANVTKTGDKIQVEAAVEDDSIEKAVADFSRFIFNAKDINADICAKTGKRTFVCSWTTASIDIEGFINDFIRFKFADIAGNTLEVAEPFKVFGLAGEETPDFWQSSVRCSPSLLDRETLPLINQRAFCLVSLKPKSLANASTFGNVEPIAVSLGECSGNTSFVEEVMLENNDFSKEPLLSINFRNQDARIDEISLLCSLDIISRKGNNIVTTPEKENVNINFKLYNQPLGEVSESVQKKIDDAIEDSDNILKFATSFKKIFFYGERLCNAGNAIANVIVIYKVIGSAIAGWETFLKPTPAGEAVTLERIHWDTSTEQLRSLVVNQYYPKFITQACNLVNCKTVIDTSSGALRVDENAIAFDFEGPDSLLGKWRQSGKGIIETLDVGNIVGKYVGGKGEVVTPDRFMNPKDSIVVASLTASIPGIIYGLDKYRQEQCMYADCLQPGVGKQGLPEFACEDQKSYATCKYVVGEAFKVIPITAAFDYYMNLIKSTLANPFKILGAGMAATCNPTIVAEPFSYEICAGAKIASFLGVTIQEVTSIFDSNTWTIHDDFCKRLNKK
ncbi:MAG: hypothetical protein AABX51_06745 [Nanoarchaeota archaeon]